MWPFSSVKRAPAERPDWQEEFADIKLRLKTLEREHDDLHAAYRRLRAQKAQEAVGEAKAYPKRSDEQDDPREPGFDKEALRRKYLGRPRGNGGM